MIIFIAFSFVIMCTVNAVPPEACYAEFNWADCGKAPTPVVYYWKPGSRCEVAMWRGCLPNMNMFENEFECVSTCIFTARALPEDYHVNNEIDNDLDFGVTPDVETTLSEYANSTVTDANNSIIADREKTEADNTAAVEGITNAAALGEEATTIVEAQ